MASAQLGSVLRYLRTAGPASAASDRELLERFCAERDEPAFAQLLRRHGPMVLQVGRRVLRREPDAEDVLQATFLLLARKAASIRKRESVGSWLHGVAYRLALQVRQREARRGAHEREAAQMRKSATTVEAAWQELRETLDRALRELPEHHRAVLLLCYFEGQTQEEAARRLGCPLGTVRSRLARARTALQRRLARHGLALSAGGLATALAADDAAGVVPAGLLRSTREAALRFASGDGTTGLVSAGAASLAEGGLKTMFASKARAVMALVLAVGLLVGGAGALSWPAAPNPPTAADPAEKPRLATPPAAAPLPDGALARLGTLRFRDGSEVLAVSFSPDGKQIVSGDLDGLCLWEVATGKKLFQAQRKDGGASIVTFSPDGKMVAAAGQDRVVVWDATSWKAKRYELKAPGESFQSVAFSADSKALAAGTSKGTVYLWDMTTGQETGRLEGHQGIVSCVAFSPDGKVLASGCYDKTARLWDVVAAKELHQLKGHGGPVLSVAFDRDGKTIATGACGPNEPLHVWDVGTGKELRQVKGGHRDGARCLAFCPDGKSMISQNYYSLWLWDRSTGKELRQYSAPDDRFPVGSVALTADGKTLAVAQWAGIRLWDVDSGKELHPAAGHCGVVRAVTFSPDGRMLASGGHDGTILWDGPTGKQLRRLPDPGTRSDALAFSPDGKLLAVGRAGGNGIRLWDPVTGKEARETLKAPGHIFSVAFSPDGKFLVSGGMDGTVRVWELATGKEVRHFGAGSGRSLALAFSPDGKLLAVGSDDNLIRLWDFAAGKELRRCEGHESHFGGGIRSLTFSPDGKTLASAGEDFTARLWDVAQGKELARLDRRLGPVASVAFSPNGRMLAAAGWNRTYLWEVATNRERRRFEGHQGWVYGVAFSADGKTVASAGEDTTALLWDATGATRPGRRDAKLTAEQLKALWADLAGADAPRAYEALRRLASAPNEALPYLRKHLAPVVPVEEKRLARLIAELDSDEFAVREKAAAALKSLGSAAVPLCRKALEGRPSAEVRRVLKQFLEQAARDAWSPPPERLRVLRALEALELAATKEAREVLDALARGAPGAWLTEEAKAALNRLAKRPDLRP